MIGIPGIVLVWSASAVAAVAASAAVLWATRRLRLVDRPTERSAHARPMPTAGGLGIMAGFWSGALALWWAGASGESVRSWAGGLGASTALLVWMAWDDLVRPLRVLEKLALVGAAAAVWLWLAGTPPQLGVAPAAAVGSGPAIVAVSALWLVSLATACNFMDGIDGIVALHALVTGLAGAALLAWRGGPWGLPLCLSAAAAGFLWLNWPPARLFMGDVGAHFIGFGLATATLCGQTHGLPLWTGLVLHGVFVFDTGYTLVRRALHGENLVRAHQKHLYQRLVRCGWSHARVDVGVGVLDLLLAGTCLAHLAARTALALLLLGGVAAILVAVVIYVERRDRCFS